MQEKDELEIKQNVIFDYIKSTSFRSLRADGAVGGVTPNGHVHISLYSERGAIPKREIHEVSDDGRLSDLVQVTSRHSIVREMEADIFLRLDIAKSIHKWLGKVIEDAEQLEKEQY